MGGATRPPPVPCRPRAAAAPPESRRAPEDPGRVRLGRRRRIARAPRDRLRAALASGAAGVVVGRRGAVGGRRDRSPAADPSPAAGRSSSGIGDRGRVVRRRVGRGRRSVVWSWSCPRRSCRSWSRPDRCSWSSWGRPSRRSPRLQAVPAASAPAARPAATSAATPAERFALVRPAGLRFRCAQPSLSSCCFTGRPAGRLHVRRIGRERRSVSPIGTISPAYPF